MRIYKGEKMYLVRRISGGIKRKNYTIVYEENIGYFLEGFHKPPFNKEVLLAQLLELDVLQELRCPCFVFQRIK
jgi:hypothetical protein